MGQVLSKGITSDFNVDQMEMTESKVSVNNIPDESVCDDYSIQRLVVGPRRNLEEIIVEADSADSLFLGGVRKLVQSSVRQKKVTKDFGDIMAEDICSMV